MSTPNQPEPSREAMEIVITQKDKLRFEAKFEKSGDDKCWLWTAGKYTTGYGSFHHGIGPLKRHYPAQRMSWMIYHGPIPKGIFVCHRCDVPLCVNPSHLFLGTYLDNIRDAFLKGRFKGKKRGCLCGEESPSSKITSGDVRSILSLHETGLSDYEIAKQFIISRSSIQRIRSGESWKKIYEEFHNKTV